MSLSMCSLHQEVQAELASALLILQVSSNKKQNAISENGIFKMVMETAGQNVPSLADSSERDTFQVFDA